MNFDENVEFCAAYVREIKPPVVAYTITGKPSLYNNKLNYFKQICWFGLPFGKLDEHIT